MEDMYRESRFEMFINSASSRNGFLKISSSLFKEKIWKRNGIVPAHNLFRSCDFFW